MKIPIQKIAELANIRLNPEEEIRLSKDLDKILAHAEEINAIPGLDKINPTSHPLASENVFREDRVINQATAREILKHAPASHGNFFKVPKVIESE